MRRRLVLLPALFAVLVPSGADAQERRVVDDPGGLPSWTAEVRPGPGSSECTVLYRGRLLRGRYCAGFSRSRVFSYTQRRETGTDTRGWRTIFVITFSRSVLSARLQTPDGVVAYRRGRGPRVLLAVLSGNVEQSPLEVTAIVGRERRRILTGPPPTVTVDDPLGGAAWRLAPDRDQRGADRLCVAWQRVRSRFGEPAGERAAGTPRCGDPDAVLPVAAAERVEGRLVVTGESSRRLRQVKLTGAEGATLRYDHRSREFLAVLPGDTDLAALRVVATLPDGRTVTQALRSAAAPDAFS